jgi:dolichyl-diphosphooligosaccharide--protein glycosyltransferase
MDTLISFLPFKQFLPNKLSYDKQETFLKLFILTFAGILAFATRLFSVLRYESVIHEFDPYFNYRTTKFLADEGFYSFHNWFDDRAWYPLGRIIGGTIYPGLMVTSAALYHALRWFHITIDIRNVCVFLAPLFSSFTVIVTYLLTKELKVNNKFYSKKTFFCLFRTQVLVLLLHVLSRLYPVIFHVQLLVLMIMKALQYFVCY